MCINTQIVVGTSVIMSNAVLWSTWEELLLAFAVKRHGLKDWDKVAMELQNRRRRHNGTSSYTAQICRDRYRNLKRRFSTNRRGASENKNDFTGDDDDDDDNGAGGGGGDDSFLWLEELRKLRVAELKQEVHRYDDSIRSLQIKVKTMEEERDRNDAVKKPDLDDDELQRERSENDNKKPPEHVGGKSASGGGEEEENASFHESNSAGNREAFLKTEPAEAKPESCNDSSDTHEIRKKRMTRGDVRVESEESKEGTKDSSDVQSSASKRKRSKTAEGRGGNAPIKRESGGVKTEPPAVLFSVLEKVRAHKHGLVFQRRLPTQKTEKYKKTIRRHVDLETIQARMDDGSYSSCPTKFYVDLLLLFNNAVVFFPKASAESRAARDLRQLVTKEMKNDISSRPPQPVKPESSDSLLARHKYANPIVVCRKRSSISAKPGPSSANKKVEKQKNTSDKPVASAKPLAKSPLSTSNEDDDLGKLKIKEKPVTGVRSMRRGGGKGKPKTEPAPSTSQSKSVSAQQHGGKDEVEGSKGDKRKTEAPVAVKKTGAADFLKRMKKNSPAKGAAVETSKSSKDNSAKGGKKEPPAKKKLDERKDGPVRRSGGGGATGSGGGQRQTKEDAKRTSTGRPAKEKEVVVFTRKRGKDVEGDGSSQRDKKRPRQLRIDDD